MIYTNVLALAYALRDQLHHNGFTNVGALIGTKGTAGLILQLGDNLQKQIPLTDKHLAIPFDTLVSEIQKIILKLN